MTRKLVINHSIEGKSTETKNGWSRLHCAEWRKNGTLDGNESWVPGRYNKILSQRKSLGSISTECQCHRTRPEMKLNLKLLSYGWFMANQSLYSSPPSPGICPKTPSRCLKPQIVPSPIYTLCFVLFFFLYVLFFFLYTCIFSLKVCDGFSLVYYYSCQHYYSCTLGLLLGK